jgi:hypothetical protein
MSARVLSMIELVCSAAHPSRFIHRARAAPPTTKLDPSLLVLVRSNSNGPLGRHQIPRRCVRKANFQVSMTDLCRHSRDDPVRATEGQRDYRKVNGFEGSSRILLVLIHDSLRCHQEAGRSRLRLTVLMGTSTVKLSASLTCTRPRD